MLSDKPFIRLKFSKLALREIKCESLSTSYVARVATSQDDCRTISWKPLLATNKRNESGGGGGVFRKTFRGARSNRSESMKAAHIAFVLPATEADPSHPGFFGTRALRLSEDIPNPARTFSLLYGDWGGVAMGVEQRVQSGANGTLDLECDDDGMYAMLFQVTIG